MRTKRNLLFISSFPLPLTKGSNQHAYFFLKALSHHFNVYGIFFVQPGEARVSSTDSSHENELLSLGIQGYELCSFADHSSDGRYRNILESLVAFPSVYMNQAVHEKGIRLIDSIIKSHSIELVHFEQSHYFKYTKYIPKSIKKIIVYHDLYHSIPWKQMKYEKSYFVKLDSFMKTFKMFYFEKMLDSQIDLKIFLNPVEMSELPWKATFVPHIVNPRIRYVEPARGHGRHILFMGGYNHPPNRLSVRYIVDTIVPALAGKCEDFVVHIAGSGMERFAQYVERSPLRDRIRLRGFVEDINRVFEGMDIALFPILYGGGIKTKVIEAMAAGVPVTTTPEGVTGLSGLPPGAVGVGMTSEELVCDLVTLMRSETLRRTRSKEAWRYVDRMHSYSSLVDRVGQVYGAL